MTNDLRAAVVLLGALALLTGIVYPLAVTGIAQVVFPSAASGSLLVVDGRARGSSLIGQAFSAPGYFWSRPSATSPVPYNAAASAGSNLGPTNPALVAAVQERVAALRAADPGLTGPIPVDLVTASASGLDPDISPAAALVQVPRVARARGLREELLRQLVRTHIESRAFGFVGEPRVNVLALNLALDRLRP
ncbi:MAG: potassium-transporting ATPase subunit C [Acidobacteria bacterium RBG_13_68_16]|nr:MAG: potassium-transporting ATPase subunit C [Acidobacteria bacterium RBG_13_68_16]